MVVYYTGRQIQAFVKETRSLEEVVWQYKLVFRTRLNYLEHLNTVSDLVAGFRVELREINGVAKNRVDKYFFYCNAEMFIFDSALYCLDFTIHLVMTNQIAVFSCMLYNMY